MSTGDEAVGHLKGCLNVGCLLVFLFFVIAGAYITVRIVWVFLSGTDQAVQYYIPDSGNEYYMFQEGRFQMDGEFRPRGRVERPRLWGKTIVRTNPYGFLVSSYRPAHEIKAVKFLEVSAHLPDGRKLDFFDNTEMRCSVGPSPNWRSLTFEEVEKFRIDRELEVETVYAEEEYAEPGANGGIPSRIILEYGHITVEFRIDIDFETVDDFFMEIRIEFHYESGEKITETMMKKYGKKIEEYKGVRDEN